MKTKTNRKEICLTALALACSIFNTAIANDWTGNVSGMIASVSLNDNDWGDHDEQKAIGIVADFRKTAWPVSISVDLTGFGDEYTNQSTNSEITGAALDLGVRKVFEEMGSLFKPYVGIGVSLENAELRVKNTDTGLSNTEDDSYSGAWIGAGGYFRVNDHFQFGLDLRYSDADVDLLDNIYDTAGLQIALTIGYHW